MRIVGLILAAAAMHSNRRSTALALVGAIVATTSFAWVGHAHAAVPNRLPTLLLCVHLLCVAFWIGALAPLYLVARDGNPSEIALTAARFGKIAIGAVGLLIAAGAGLLWILIRSVSDLWISGYGLMVLGKLALVAFLLGVAALNRLYLTPRLMSADPRGTRNLARSIKAEMFLACLILLVTAAFTTIAGPPK
jgi:putative copper resistance protein D